MQYSDRGKVHYFPFCLLIMFKIQLTGLHQGLKGRWCEFCERSTFSVTFSPGYPLVISFGDNRAQLCTSRENQILQGIMQGSSSQYFLMLVGRPIYLQRCGCNSIVEMLEYICAASPISWPAMKRILVKLPGPICWKREEFE